MKESVVNRKNEIIKKEHYVPRCYLRRWKNEKNQIYVYDKINKRNWASNVKDIACERFFYDMKGSELYEKELMLLHEHEIIPEKDEQFVEHFLSEQVENEYSKLLQKIVDKEISKWYEKNCFFIDEIDKIKMSICLVYQHIRTKRIRKMIRDDSDHLEQMLRKMNYSEEIIKGYILDKNEEKIIQGNMLFDLDNIFELNNSFQNLSWVLGINKTNVEFQTSDHPIGIFSHTMGINSIMLGIESYSAEIYFPLSPKHILLMWDVRYHKKFIPHDRKYMSIDDIQTVKRYNELCADNSYQYIFSREK